jgi:DNA-binding response OmpR family regulator
MKIFLVEDNRVLAKSLVRGLKQEGFLVEYFMRGDDGEKFFLVNYKMFDVVILDLMLPGKSGEEICASIRKREIDVPILMLTAKDAVEDKVNGLNIGADDYLTKPFECDELVARLRALLRRTPQVQREQMQLSPNVMIDFGKVAVYKEGKEIVLSPKEYAILETLAKNEGQALTREQIFDKVMDFAADNWSNAIDVHIKNIRKKLFKDEKYDPIKTVRGVGYRLDTNE